MNISLQTVDPAVLASDDFEETCRAGLLSAFQSISDRRDSRGRRHDLAPQLCLVVVALLSGCENVTHIRQFGFAHPEVLAALGFRPSKRPRNRARRGVIFSPDEETLAAALAQVSPDDLNRCLGAWLAAMLEKEETASIDGKALRGSKGYVLSVFVDRIRHVVWQQDVGEKANELSTLEGALAQILASYPRLALVTGDAGFGHKSIARGVAAARRDYFLQLKSPHETDVGIAREAFAQITQARKPLSRTVEKRGARTDAKS